MLDAGCKEFLHLKLSRCRFGAYLPIESECIEFISAERYCVGSRIEVGCLGDVADGAFSSAFQQRLDFLRIFNSFSVYPSLLYRVSSVFVRSGMDPFIAFNVDQLGTFIAYLLNLSSFCCGYPELWSIGNQLLMICHCLDKIKY